MSLFQMFDCNIRKTKSVFHCLVINSHVIKSSFYKQNFFIERTLKIAVVTRMHSSKMRTARFGPFFFVVIGLSCQFKCSFFVPSYLPTTPLPCEQTNTCQNITFSKLRWRAVITACKRSLRRLCFYTCLSVILFTGGRAGLHGGGVGRSSPIRYYGIWSASERYASYWNAFLLHNLCASGRTRTYEKGLRTAVQGTLPHLW